MIDDPTPPAAADDRIVFAPDLGVYVAFLAVPRPQVIYVKLLVEAYEEIAVARSNEHIHDPATAEVVVLAVPDFIDATRRLLETLRLESCAELLQPDATRMAELRATIADWSETDQLADGESLSGESAEAEAEPRPKAQATPTDTP